jgi:glucose/mannose-6-phosphate isomerase
VTSPSARLDDRHFLESRDASGMWRLVHDFPRQFETHPVLEPGGVADSGAAPPASARTWIGAMGGSAFAGEMLAPSFAGSLEITLVRSYTLPPAAAPGDRFVALSYSGNTAETLATFAEAGRRGLRRAAVTSGGALAELARQDGVPLLRIPGGLPPRAAAGLAYTAAYACLRPALAGGAGGLAGEAPGEPARIARRLSPCPELWGPAAPAAANLAKSTAAALHGRLPFVYAASGPAEAALVRWRGQLNENAKILCHTAVLPELHHNEVVGWNGDDPWVGTATVLLLREGSEDRETSRRLDVTREWLERRGVPVVELAALGETIPERVWWLCHLSDYVSLHLAALREVDPTPVAAIDELKKRLSEESA